MATTRFAPGQKPASSPRPKGRDNAKDTLCRNVLIYGHCRYEDQGCSFNHEPKQLHGSQSDQQRKTLNVDSPSFTPTALANSTVNTTMTSRAASAAPFTPRSVASGTATPNIQPEESSTFNPAQIREFRPQNYDLNNSALNSGPVEPQLPYGDPFTMASGTQAVTAAQYNPYDTDANNIGAGGASYYPSQTAYTTPSQPVQYHLYAPIAPHRETLLPYQRQAHDFFMPEKLREELQKKSEASLQTMPNSQLPTLDNYHSLVALDTNLHKNAAIFGFPSWVYKATSSRDGNLYCLRRLEGYRLTDDKAVRPAKEWRRVNNAGIVSVKDAFTTRVFGDSSLIIVTDYHPLSKTLAETHFANTSRFGNRTSSAVQESILWTYIVQIASAIKSVHAANLAVRCLDASKVLLTGKNRVRLSACSVLDIVLYDEQRPVLELQQEDLYQFGKLVLSIATNSPITPQNQQAALGQLESRGYTSDLVQAVTWLLYPVQPQISKSIDDFLCAISGRIIASFDMALHSDDTVTSELSRELENGRIVRLMAKLNTINERPEYEGDPRWSETGDRYVLKLFRDYVFHQVDSAGHAVVDLGHMISCLNKLDAGSTEQIQLASRDESSIFVVSYKDLKKQVAAAFAELTKQPKSHRGF